MPNSPPRPCAHPGCNVLVKLGRCGKHQRQVDATRQASRQAYDRNRGSNTQREDSGQWRKARLVFLELHPVCPCGASSQVVDHIIPHRGDMALFWDQSNWAAKCVTCHNRKTAQQDGGFGNPIRG